MLSEDGRNNMHYWQHPQSTTTTKQVRIPSEISPVPKSKIPPVFKPVEQSQPT